MKKTTTVLLAIAVILPLVLLFWPFAEWGGVMSLLLRVIPAFAAQMLLFGSGKWNAVRILPTLLTLALAAWGIYLYFTSPHWSGATVGGLVADYISPLIGCAVALATCLLTKKKPSADDGT